MPPRPLRLFPRHPSRDQNPESKPCSAAAEVAGTAGRPAERLDPKRERELDRVAGAARPKTVAVSLASIVPLLIDAVENDRAWLNDFLEEPVRIDADLYEVLLAYQQLRRPAAA